MKRRFLYIYKYCIYIFIFTAAFLLPAAAGDAARAATVGEDYDSLSRLSSQQLMERGRQHFERREAARALACFTIVGQRTEGGSDEQKLVIRALNNCGCVYKYFYFDYIQAFNCFTRAYDLCEDCHYDEFLPAIMVNLGDLLNDYGVNYESQSLLQQACEIFDHCIETAFQSKNWELLTTAFFNLSNQNYTLQLDGYRRIFSEEIPDSTPDLGFARQQFLGIECLQKGQTAQAREHFTQQLEQISARWEPERDSLAAFVNIAQTFRQEKDYGREAAYLKRALQLCVDNDISDQEYAICKLLSDCFQNMGDRDMQQHYRMLYLEKKEAAHNNKLVSIGELSYIYELTREEEKARVLASRQRLQQLTILAIAVILLVVLVSALMMWRKNRQLKAGNNSLFEKYSRLLKTEERLQQLQRENEQLQSENQQLLSQAVPITPVGPAPIPPTAPTASASTDEKYSRSSLTDEQKKALLHRIQEIMQDSELICQQDFSSSRLAKLADSNTTYVSQVINEKYGMTFSNLLGRCRVKIACMRMNDPDKYGNVTIEAIAMGTGFKSRTAFINAFKRETGLTPSDYLRIANEKHA